MLDKNSLMLETKFFEIIISSLLKKSCYSNENIDRFVRIEVQLQKQRLNKIVKRIVNIKLNYMF